MNFPWSLEQLNQLSLVSLTEDQLIKEVLKLKEGFTTSRESKLQNYLASKEAVSAYFQYYFPTNFPKLEFLIQQLPEKYLESLRQKRWIDYGCGPGTYSAALLSLPQELRPSEIILVDSSALMLQQAQKFLSASFPEQKFQFLTSLPESILQDRNSVLFFGNSLNEMSQNFALSLLKRFAGDDIIWIEPGTMKSFETLVQYRSFLIEQNFQVLYPCANSSSQCPARSKIATEWCHQVLRMTHCDWIERLSQKMQIDRKEMPLIAHAYSKQCSLSQKVERVVRIRPETKHSLEWDVCREKLDEQGLEWRRVSVVKKPLSKSALKFFDKMSTGISVELEVVKELGDGTQRVQIKALPA